MVKIYIDIVRNLIYQISMRFKNDLISPSSLIQRVFQNDTSANARTQIFFASANLNRNLLFSFVKLDQQLAVLPAFNAAPINTVKLD